jgi:hypothetical protein
VREFTVSLRSGNRLVIRADRCIVRIDGLIELVAGPPPREPEIGRFEERPDIVAVFDRQEIEWLADNAQLVSVSEPADDDNEPIAF